MVKLNLRNLKKQEIFGDQEIDKIMRYFDSHGSPFYLRKTQQHLTPDLLLEIHKNNKSWPDNLVLIGWMPIDLVRPQFNRPVAAGSGLTLVSWALQVKTTS